MSHIIIEDLLVIGHRVLGWIDEWLRQASGVMNVKYRRFSVITVLPEHRT